jgi:Icc protein
VFAAVLGSGHLGPDGTGVERLVSETGDERAAVSEVAGLRVITLDSLVPGSVQGLVSDAQLAWLGRRTRLGHSGGGDQGRP